MRVGARCYPAELSVAMQIPDFDGRNVKPCRAGRQLGSPGARTPNHAGDCILSAALAGTGRNPNNSQSPNRR